MGMFDNVRCEQPLPIQWEPHGGIWQTKSLDCSLDTYTITADGRLMRRAGRWGAGTVPAMEIPYHGDIELHDYDKHKGWVSLIVRFTEGRFSRVWLEEWRAPINKPDTAPTADIVAAIKASPTPLATEGKSEDADA